MTIGPDYVVSFKNPKMFAIRALAGRRVASVISRTNYTLPDTISILSDEMTAVIHSEDVISNVFSFVPPLRSLPRKSWRRMLRKSTRRTTLPTFVYGI